MKTTKKGKRVISFNLIVSLPFFKLILTPYYLYLKTKRGKKEKKGEGNEKKTEKEKEPPFLKQQKGSFN